MTTKGERFVVAADSHGDQVDEETANALFAFCKDYKPTIRVHAGDAWDFRNLRNRIALIRAMPAPSIRVSWNGCRWSPSEPSRWRSSRPG